jgi:hypothetical protein
MQIVQLRRLRTGHRVNIELEQSELGRSVVFTFDQFFHFLDCDNERTEIELSAAIRRASLPIATTSGLVLHPSNTRHLFVFDLFEEEVVDCRGHHWVCKLRLLNIYIYIYIYTHIYIYIYIKI